MESIEKQLKCLQGHHYGRHCHHFKLKINDNVDEQKQAVVNGEPLPVSEAPMCVLLQGQTPFFIPL